MESGVKPHRRWKLSLRQLWRANNGGTASAESTEIVLYSGQDIRQALVAVVGDGLTEQISAIRALTRQLTQERRVTNEEELDDFRKSAQNA